MFAEPQRRLLEVSDVELIVAAARGDEGAFGQLYRRHSRFLAGVVFRLLGNEADLDELVQLTFVDALRSLPTLTRGESIRGWLCRLSVRQVNRRLKRRMRWGKFGRALAPLLRRRAPREARRGIDLYGLLQAAAPEDRTAWLLHHVQGESLPECAELCEAPLSTIKRRIARTERLVQGSLR